MKCAQNCSIVYALVFLCVIVLCVRNGSHFIRSVQYSYNSYQISNPYVLAHLKSVELNGRHCVIIGKDPLPEELSQQMLKIRIHVRVDGRETAIRVLKRNLIPADMFSERPYTDSRISDEELLS